jgi:hypothetical protein
MLSLCMRCAISYRGISASLSSLRAYWSSSSRSVSILRYEGWDSTSLYASYNITEALPQVKRLEARQRRQGPRQHLPAFKPQLIVPAPWHGSLRHEAIRSHLGPLGPRSLGRVLGALRLALSSGCSLAWASLPASPLAPAGDGACLRPCHGWYGP